VCATEKNTERTEGVEGSPAYAAPELSMSGGVVDGGGVAVDSAPAAAVKQSLCNCCPQLHRITMRRWTCSASL